MISPQRILRSPLARNPGLLARAITRRLISPPVLKWSQPPAGLAARPLDSLANTLRAWIERSLVARHAPSFFEVFGHAFAPEDLWPLCRSGPSREPGLERDIKLIWEFGRCHAAPLKAMAGAPPAAIAADLRAWFDHNPPGSIAWQCPMDVAIRAVNWVAADSISNGSLRAAFGANDWDRILWNSGREIWHGLEARLVSSNHYLANLLGLFFLGHHLNARRWLRFAQREWPRALAGQTRADGGLDEASLPYHALVTEMALWFAAVSDDPTGPVARMVQILADASEPGWDVFPIGDDDGGRILAFDALSAGSRADNLLALAEVLGISFERRQPEALYPDSGWWFCRRGPWKVAFEFGGVGLGGGGGHAHNDTLSFCMNFRGRPILSDPGSYLYTGDPDARNRFRSVRAHSTIQWDDDEPLAIPDRTADDLFRLPGPDRACPFRRPHPGAISATHRTPRGTHVRTIEVEDRLLRVTDEVNGHPAARITARFVLHPDVRARIFEGAVLLSVPDTDPIRLSCESEPASFRLEPGSFATCFGALQDTLVVAASFTSRQIAWKLEAP